MSRQLQLRSHFKNEGYCVEQRAYVIQCDRYQEGSSPSILNFEVLASEESPTFNPAFLIKD